MDNLSDVVDDIVVSSIKHSIELYHLVVYLGYLLDKLFDIRVKLFLQFLGA